MFVDSIFIKILTYCCSITAIVDANLNFLNKTAVQIQFSKQKSESFAWTDVIPRNMINNVRSLAPELRQMVLKLLFVLNSKPGPLNFHSSLITLLKFIFLEQNNKWYIITKNINGIHIRCHLTKTIKRNKIIHNTVLIVKSGGRKGRARLPFSM